MDQLIKGKPIAHAILADVQKRVQILRQHGVLPTLAVVLVGDDKPSATYVRKKEETATLVGIEFMLHTFPTSISQQDLISSIADIQQHEALTGLIVQLPIPEHLYTRDVLDSVSSRIDVDCLHSTHMSILEHRMPAMIPPTPGAVLSILEHLSIDVAGKHVTILGRGALVGKPMALIMKHMGAKVDVCHSKTINTKECCLQADIIVSAVGKKNIIRGDMVKPGTIVIDTGICFENKKMYGDVNVPEVLAAGARVTPTPGGVGPITVARLLLNTIICAEQSTVIKN